MSNLGLIAIGIGLAVLQAVVNRVLPFGILTPDFVLPLVVYLALINVNAARGAAIAFVVGYFLDTLEPGAPICLNMFILVSLFLIIRALSVRLLLAGTVFHVLVTFLGSLLGSLLVVAVRAIFERQVAGLQPLVLIMISRAMSTAVVAPFVFTFLKRLDSRRTRRREEGALR